MHGVDALPPNTSTNATNANKMPKVATKFSFSLNNTTPANVGSTTDS